MFGWIGDLKKSWKIFVSDKVIMAFGTIPVVIGVLIYFLLGGWLYGDFLNYGQKWVEKTITSGFWGDVLYYILAAVMTIALYFLVNWTFVLIVSLIACPFNDLISARVEKIVLQQQPDSVKESIRKMCVRYFKILINEMKKIAFVALLTFLSFIFSLAGLVPISFILSALLLAMAFVDYSWSRHELSFAQCVKDVKRSFFSYTIAGAIFLLLMAVPFVNILALPLAVVHFTLLFAKKRVMCS